jgi:hypothetical protein
LYYSGLLIHGLGQNSMQEWYNLSRKYTPLATASRLLAMKRPDYFICLDSANKRRFSKDFSLPISALNLNNYWDEIIERIMECVWWNSHPPNEGDQREVWNARSAFLDALYYVPN